MIDSFIQRCQRKHIKNVRRKIVLSETGYLQIFMYYVQTAALLKLDIILTEDPDFDVLPRPGDVLPQVWKNITKSIFNFNVLTLGTDKCVLKGLRSVRKTGLSTAFILYFFVVLIVMYVLNSLCCCWSKAGRNLRLGGITMHSRIMMTAILLFLYTYQVM